MNNGKLTDQEKSTLEKIANGPDELLGKRAIIILMTDSGSSVANIAKEVSLTPKTVQRWQKEFSQKHLGIFFDDAINGTQPFANPVMTPVAEMEPEPAVQTAPKPLKKKKQAKKESNIPSDWLQSGELIEYPVRDQIGLEPSDTLAEAGRKVLSFYFGQMLTHEPGARLGSDVEAVHDMRVATRRMRAAFRVFESGFSKKAIKPLRAGLQTTGRVLGEVRDLDVLLEKLHQYRQSLPEKEQPGLQPLLEMWLAEREEAREEMLAYLGSKKYRRFKQDLLKFVTTADGGAKSISDDGPVTYQLRYLVPCLIYEQFRDLHTHDGLLEDATMDTLHQLRITFKQLRYTLEYFAEILGEEGKLVIEEVKALQDHLGELNDARVASDLLRALLADWDKKQRRLPQAEPQNPTQLAAYLQARLEVQQHLLETFPQAWARFNRPELRRNLALVVAVL